MLSVWQAKTSARTRVDHLSRKTTSGRLILAAESLRFGAIAMVLLYHFGVSVFIISPNAHRRWSVMLHAFLHFFPGGFLAADLYSTSWRSQAHAPWWWRGPMERPAMAQEASLGTVTRVRHLSTSTNSGSRC